MSEQKMRDAFKAAFQKAHWVDHKTYDECIDAGITAALATPAGEQVGLTDAELDETVGFEPVTAKMRWMMRAVIAAHEAKKNGGAV